MSRVTLLLCVAALVVCGLAACGPSQSEAAAEERSAEWAALQEQHAGLSELRSELYEIRAQIDAGPEGDEETGLSPEEELLQLEQAADEQEGRVIEAADAFLTPLVEFINKHAVYEGEEPYPEQQAAIRLKSDEDIELAREYVVKGGDYKRALDILAKIPDPGYGAIDDEIAKLESLRYMDEERFSKVEKGQSEGEVRALLGQVFHGNRREYDDREITAWFYPKEEGAAAAVYFRDERGTPRVYDMNFEAVKKASERVE